MDTPRRSENIIVTMTTAVSPSTSSFPLLDLQNKVLAFMMAAHPRLGMGSAANPMCTFLMCDLAQTHILGPVKDRLNKLMQHLPAFLASQDFICSHWSQELQIKLLECLEDNQHAPRALLLTKEEANLIASNHGSHQMAQAEFGGLRDIMDSVCTQVQQQLQSGNDTAAAEVCILLAPNSRLMEPPKQLCCCHHRNLGHVTMSELDELEEGYGFIGHICVEESFEAYRTCMMDLVNKHPGINVRSYLAEMLIVQLCLLLVTTSAAGKVVSATQKDGQTTMVFESAAAGRFSTLLRVGGLGSVVHLQYTYLGKV